MLIELLPKKHQHTITLKVSDDGYTTEYSLADYIEIGRAYKAAIENHYKFVAAERIKNLCG